MFRFLNGTLVLPDRLLPGGELVTRDDRIAHVGPAVAGVELGFTPQRELLIRSPGLFKEYYKNPEATREAKDAEGWFHTGDAGYIDRDGHLRIIDRARDVGKLADGTLFAPKYLENKLKFFPYIKEAVAFGAGRDRVGAFVNIDMDAVSNWAEKRNLAYSGYTDLAQSDAVYELVAGCIAQANADLAREPELAGSQIHRFLILHKELDADDGELTRTRKVRRRFIGEKYGSLVEALYDDRETVHVEAQVRYEDGRTGTFSADLKIRALPANLPDSLSYDLSPLVDFDNFIYRAADPTTRDMALGAICILLVLEATRRTAGWVLPITATCFILYTFYGPLLDLVGLGMIAHRGYDLARIVGTIYMTLEGIFGVPLDVAASYIILFSIYGAILGASGAGKFFLEWAMAAVGSADESAV